MNTFRLLKALLFAYFAPISNTGHLRFWVTPFDCDINWHLNNANYLKLMDVGRYDFFVRTGMMRAFFKKLYRPAAVRVEIDFKKSLPPGTFITLDTSIVGRSDRSFLMRQAFYTGSKLVAEAKVVFVVTRKGKSLATETLLPILPPTLQKTLMTT